MTTNGRALTRVCVVDFDLAKVVYDRLVTVSARSPTISHGRFAKFFVFPALNRNPSDSGIIVAALDPITTTLVNVQIYLCTPSKIVLGDPLESDIHTLQLALPGRIDTAPHFHRPRGQPLKPGLAGFTYKWLGRIIQDRGPGVRNPEQDARACIDLLERTVHPSPVRPAETEITISPA